MKFRQIILFVILGSTIRLLYGLYFAFWKATPDQLAWELSLTQFIETAAHYKYLIHHPHEGGTLIIGLLSLPFKFLSSSHALIFSGVLFDSISRFLQIKISASLFGRQMAIFYAAWSCISLPLLLPWATVNAGLHSIAAVFPFLFIYYITKNARSAGLLTGLAIAFCYDSIVLLISGLLYYLIIDIKLRNWKSSVHFLVFSALGLLPHILLRLLFDHEIYIGDFGDLLKIRGLSKNQLLPDDVPDALAIGFFETLPASLFLNASNALFTMDGLRYLSLSFIGIAFILFLMRKDLHKPLTMVAWSAIILYLLIYSISPYLELKPRSNFVFYRHLAYIVPLLFLMCFHSILKLNNRGWIIISCWLCITLYLNVSYAMHLKVVTEKTWRATGWILAGKFGREPATLMRMQESAGSEARDELLIGYGWGLATYILSSNKSDSVKVMNLKAALAAFPPEQQTKLNEGVRFAFHPDVRPVLNKKLLENL